MRSKGSTRMTAMRVERVTTASRRAAIRSSSRRLVRPLARAATPNLAVPSHAARATAVERASPSCSHRHLRWAERILHGTGASSPTTARIGRTPHTRAQVRRAPRACLARRAIPNPRPATSAAFTKALVEGINGLADYSSAGKITINMLDVYISERVKKLTSGRQTPTTAKPQTVPDFPVAIKQ